jgi:dihydroorotate dehydrogenase
MYSIIRSFLFFFSPEKAHYLAMDLLNLYLKIPIICRFVKSPINNNSPFIYNGLEFPNRVGIAAGFDKNAKYLYALQALGFGHVEIGTVTPLGQEGNPQPRLFRLKKDSAIINRMGFNNDGLEVVVQRLISRPSNLIVGGNIGKNKVTPNENAADDYLKCFVALYDHVDYFTVNVSSPNTPGLRALQGKDELLKILNTLLEERKSKSNKKSIFLKITADLEDEQLIDAVEVVNETEIDGIVVSNTTIDRNKLTTPVLEVEAIGAGGVSGAPLKEKAQRACQVVKENLNEGKVLIGVGGLMTGEDARERLHSGADLVQVYTGFIYNGPNLIQSIKKLHV